MRLYSLTSSKLQPYHHVKLPLDVIADLKMWQQFLETPYSYCRPFVECFEWTSEDIQMYSDAANSVKRGFGAFCQNDWMSHSWREYGTFLDAEKPSIAYFELFGVTAAVVTWLHRFRNQKICLYTDNKSAMFMINGSASKCKNCMVLIRRIMLESMKCNCRITAKYVETDKNVLADALSRSDSARFWENAHETMHKQRTLVPEEIWPITKLWLK